MKITQKDRKTELLALLFCFVTALLLLMLCTKSSPLYPLNDWEDANIFFTMGKGMMQGKVLYRDLYDQKGPLLYLLYGLASLVSGTTFFGVFLLEVASFTAFLFICYRLFGLYAEKNRLLALPVLGALILSAMSVTHGGSVEQLCLPLFAYSLYRAVRYYQFQESGSMSYGEVLLHGVLAGCILWMKYTMLGFYIAWMGVLAISLCCKKQWKKAILSCLVFLLGMGAATLPWLVYFAANGALGDLFLYYFYYNIFQYSEFTDASIIARLLTIGRHTLATFFRNAQYSLLIVLGVAWVTFSKRVKARPWLKICLWSLAVATTFFIYFGGVGYRYYGLILAVFSALGMIPLLLLYNRLTDGKAFAARLSRYLPAALLAPALAFSFLASDNTYLLGVPRADTPQYRFAETIAENQKDETRTLLNYGFMDSGFYLTADVVPSCKYFTALNLRLPELGEEQDRFVKEKLIEFVVTEEGPLDDENYRLLDEAELYYEEEMRHYWLYQRIDAVQ